MKQKWGVFIDDLGSIHVAPCDEEGEIIDMHTLDGLCHCRPELEYSRHGILVLHQERGD